MHADSVLKSNPVPSTNVQDDPYGARESVCFSPCRPITGGPKNAHPFWGYSHTHKPGQRQPRPLQEYPHSTPSTGITLPTGIPTYHTFIMNTHILRLVHVQYTYTKTCTRTVYVFPIPYGNTHPIKTCTHTVYIFPIPNGNTHPIKTCTRTVYIFPIPNGNIHTPIITIHGYPYNHHVITTNVYPPLLLTQLKELSERETSPN